MRQTTLTTGKDRTNTAALSTAGAALATTEWYIVTCNNSLGAVAKYYRVARAPLVGKVGNPWAYNTALGWAQ